MKLFAIFTMSVLATGAWAQETPTTAGTVTVCIESLQQKRVAAATELASEIFTSAGVTVEWHDSKACPAGTHVIKIAYSYPSETKFHEGALAYALPYEGSRIQVFYSRVQAMAQRRGQQNVLAYVLVHEITHMLQGVGRHSATGIMSANWDTAEFSAMRHIELRFCSEDVTLMQASMQRWNTRAAETVTAASH